MKSLIRSLDYLKDSGLIISLELAGGAGDEGEYQEIRELAEKCPFAGYLCREDHTSRSWRRR